MQYIVKWKDKPDSKLAIHSKPLPISEALVYIAEKLKEGKTITYISGRNRKV